MYEEFNNKVFLSGRLAERPEFSHEMMGEGFYEMKLAVKRLSEQEDIIPVTISERILMPDDVEVGDSLSVTGQFRSYNKIVDGRSKLILTVFVREVTENDFEKNPNSIELTGYICKPTIYRTTPFNREICDILLAVNRSYGKSDYIPCIAWGRNARFASTFSVGDKLTIKGRIQSRNYVKLIEGEEVVKTAFEVSVNKIETYGGAAEIS